MFTHGNRENKQSHICSHLQYLEKKYIDKNSVGTLNCGTKGLNQNDKQSETLISGKHRETISCRSFNNFVPDMISPFIANTDDCDRSSEIISVTRSYQVTSLCLKLKRKYYVTRNFQHREIYPVLPVNTNTNDYFKVFYLVS